MVETLFSDFVTQFVSRLRQTGRQSPELESVAETVPPPETNVQHIELFVSCLTHSRPSAVKLSLVYGKQ